jgi:cytidylate kinase
MAERFGFLYVDTGAIYRTVGLRALREGVEPGDAAAVVPLLDKMEIVLRHDETGLQRMLLDGEDVTDAIRAPEVSMAASAVSALPQVRAFLLDMQRDLARKQSVVMDGRDIGTVVLPDAEVKIYLTASLEERSRRRLLELQAKGVETTMEEVMRDMAQRDKNDMERAEAPLRRAEDAVLVDSTELDIEQTAAAIEAIILKRMEEDDGTCG